MQRAAAMDVIYQPPETISIIVIYVHSGGFLKNTLTTEA